MPRQKKSTTPKTPAPAVYIPDLTLDQILADLKGFGIEDSEDIITMKLGGKTISLRLSNIPSEWEVQALLSAEGLKGHAWITRIKCEVLSKAISWINGISLKEDAGIFVTNPITGVEGNIRPILRDMLMGWGQEVVNTLWKLLMVHCQKIEDNLVESLPDSSTFTAVEKRFMEKALEEIQAANREIYKEAVKDILIPESD